VAARTRPKALRPLSQVLGESLYFEGLPENLISRLAGIATAASPRSGEQIFAKGDKAEGLYLVAEGRVRIFLSGPDGRERTLTVCGPGQIFGEAALFIPGGFPASAQALEDSRLAYLGKGLLLECLAAEPGLAMAVIGVMAQRLSHLAGLLEETLKALLPRLAQYLVSLAEKEPLGQEPMALRLPWPKGALATYLGVSAETLSRALRQLKDLEILSEKGRALNIRDLPALREIALGG
jgi:CRP/FNR family transcriptional regulator